MVQWVDSKTFTNTIQAIHSLWSHSTNSRNRISSQYVNGQVIRWAVVGVREAWVKWSRVYPCMLCRWGWGSWRQRAIPFHWHWAWCNATSHHRWTERRLQSALRSLRMSQPCSLENPLQMLSFVSVLVCLVIAIYDQSQICETLIICLWRDDPSMTEFMFCPQFSRLLGPS